MFNQVHNTIQTQPPAGVHQTGRRRKKAPPAGGAGWTKRRFRTSLFLVRSVLPGFVGGRLVAGHRECRHEWRSRSGWFHVANEDLAKSYVMAINGGGRIGVLLDHS